MTGQWKPGDVALVDGQVALVWQDENFTRLTFVYTDRDGDPCSVWAEGSDARPLVVIDPEDRGQAARLIAAFSDQFTSWSTDGARDAEKMQAALRSLIAPLKPEEPQGLGAVVEAVYGNRFVHIGGGKWKRVGGGEPCAYDEIDVVRILSGGVA